MRGTDAVLPACLLYRRLYIEAFTADPADFGRDAQDVLKGIIATALEVSRLQAFTGRDKPTVIT